MVPVGGCSNGFEALAICEPSGENRAPAIMDKEPGVV
jgi:hypothetical protein